MRKVTPSQAIQSLTILDTSEDNKERGIAIGVLEQYLYNRLDESSLLLKAELRIVELEKEAMQLKSLLRAKRNVLEDPKPSSPDERIEAPKIDLAMKANYPDVTLID